MITPPKLTRKKIITSIIICCFLGSLLYYLYHTYIPECDNYDSGLGWSCSIYGVETIPSITKKILEKRCETDGGESETGDILPSSHEYFSCDIPYSDAGKPCKNSTECQGCCEHTGSIPNSCIEDEEKYTCSYDLYGRCSKEFSSDCSYGRQEVKNNTIYKYKYNDQKGIISY